MSCELIRAELDAYLVGELEAEHAAEIARHVAGCAGCAGALAERRAVARALRSLPRPAAPAGFAEKFRAARMARIPAAPASAGPRPAARFRPTPWLVGSAAAAAAALLLAVTLHGTDRRTTVTEAQGPSRAAMPPAPAATARLKAETAAAEKAAKESTPAADAEALAMALDRETADRARHDSDLADNRKVTTAYKKAEETTRRLEGDQPAVATAPEGSKEMAKLQSGVPSAGPGGGVAAPQKPALLAKVPAEGSGAPLPAQAPRAPEPMRPPTATPAVEPGAGLPSPRTAETKGREALAGQTPDELSRDKRLKDLTLADGALGGLVASGALRGDSSRRNFALRAEDPEAAVRRLVRIAEGLGGREIVASADDKPADQSKEGNVPPAPATAPKPGAAPAPSPSPAPPPVMQPPSKTMSAEVGEAEARKGRRSVVLAVPASRLEAFQKALALWSEPAQGGGSADEQKTAGKASPAANALQLHLDPVFAAAERPEGQAAVAGGAGVKHDGLRAGSDGQPEKMVMFVVTVAAAGQ